MALPDKHAAIGFSVHTGWAVAVAVTGPPLRVLVRCRLELAEEAHGARFVYHVAQVQPANAERVLRDAAATASDRAKEFLRKLTQEIPGYTLVVALPPPKRVLPSMHAILGSHPLIHSAEGELFRRAIADGATTLGIPVAVVQQGLLPEAGRLGPPWGKDQKNAAGLAWAALAAPGRPASKRKE